MGALDEQSSQVSVAGLRDPELGITAARLAAPGPKAQKTSCITAFTESVLIFEREYKGQSRQRTHAMNLLESNRFRILCFGKLLDLIVEVHDLSSQSIDQCEQRTNGIFQVLWQSVQRLLCVSGDRKRRQSKPKGLHEASCGIRKASTSFNQYSPRANKDQVRMSEAASVFDGTKDPRINASIARQFLGIRTVMFPVTVGDRPQLAYIRHEDFMAHFRQVLAHPE